MKMLNTVTVIPITHFIRLFNRAVTPEKDICGLNRDIKFNTTTPTVAGKIKQLTISTAPPDKNTADG